MYIARNHAIQVPFQLKTRTKRADQKALLDSGATENFIHPRVVQRLQLKTKKLVKPRSVRNVDGTLNKAGRIEQAVEITVGYQGKKTKHNFFIADIGINDYLFGFPFFEATQLIVDWRKGKVLGPVTVESQDADKWKPSRRQQTGQRKKIPAWIRAIPDWEEGDEVWHRTVIGKMTVAQQLAIQAVDTKKKTWQEIVPPQYHKYKIWSEEE